MWKFGSRSCRAKDQDSPLPLGITPRWRSQVVPQDVLYTLFLVSADIRLGQGFRADRGARFPPATVGLRIDVQRLDWEKPELPKMLIGRVKSLLEGRDPLPLRSGC